ncbi:hypothetical protein [Paenibacillus sp. CF384]|uniref:hypothetical protein n=1 Tax=Paenibacillus sp. CF384 TaxID=1884382 RepID=UPI0008963D1D|nr:hypothetical protein [Paenibacillus sp. CF384]SDX81674.1 hypothetical protein SAMN05518855_10233 [Paenibacillus sp. CF384]
MSNNSFPFPSRNAQNTEKKIYVHGQSYDTFEEQLLSYRRKVSSEASSIKNQYLYLEDEMIKSFQYVDPTITNLPTTSVRFATIIRECSNLFEIIARSIYKQLFDINSNYQLNIFNFLSLDAFLHLRDVCLDSPSLEGEFAGHDILQPYKSLDGWDRNSSVTEEHVPQWWKAYNKVKHDINGITSHGTFANALQAVGAINIIINRVYGSGVVGGTLIKPTNDGNSNQLLVPVSKLFIDDTVITAKFG